MHRAVCRPFLNAFPVLELIARWLVRKMWRSTFQKNLNFFIWCPFDCSKSYCPITGQKMVYAGAEKNSVDCRLLLDAFLLSEFGPRWLIRKLWKYNFHKNFNFFIWSQFFCLNSDFPITGQNDESWCRNSLVTSEFFTFLTNHDTCVENEGGFYS